MGSGRLGLVRLSFNCLNNFFFFLLVGYNGRGNRCLKLDEMKCNTLPRHVRMLIAEWPHIGIGVNKRMYAVPLKYASRGSFVELPSVGTGENAAGERERTRKHTIIIINSMCSRNFDVK